MDHFHCLEIRLSFGFIPHTVAGGVKRLAAERKERLAIYFEYTFHRWH
jgi:hypothetical protein